jgi:hypothetical protein
MISIVNSFLSCIDLFELLNPQQLRRKKFEHA